MCKFYPKADSIHFRKTTERWGGLSNMCAGFNLVVNRIPIQSSEILYQACRFPSYPDLQQEILNQSNPMVAKKISKINTKYTRPGWDRNRVSIMKWVVFVKLCQNWDSFFYLLDSTGSRLIVEHSEKDDFWGAKLDSNGFYGTNVLGRILMLAREQGRIRGKDGFSTINPLTISDFILLGQTITSVTSDDKISPEMKLPF